MVKNREPRVVALSRIAQAVVNEMRGVHPESCSPTRGIPLGR
jgi:hypothetical protein